MLSQGSDVVLDSVMVDVEMLESALLESDAVLDALQGDNAALFDFVVLDTDLVLDSVALG